MANPISALAERSRSARVTSAVDAAEAILEVAATDPKVGDQQSRLPMGLPLASVWQARSADLSTGDASQEIEVGLRISADASLADALPRGVRWFLRRNLGPGDVRVSISLGEPDATDAVAFSLSSSGGKRWGRVLHFTNSEVDDADLQARIAEVRDSALAFQESRTRFDHRALISE